MNDNIISLCRLNTGYWCCLGWGRRGRRGKRDQRAAVLETPAGFQPNSEFVAGDFTLPVYEIYKAGSDLYWENGLRLTEQIGLNLTIVTHWNNKEGGKDLDTSRCFMGRARFDRLLELLPAGETILGIEEHTAVIIDPAAAPSDVAMLGESILELLKKRKVARDEGLFEEADRIREMLLGLGYEVRDEEEGQKIYIAVARSLGSSQ